MIMTKFMSVKTKRGQLKNATMKLQIKGRLREIDHWQDILFMDAHEIGGQDSNKHGSNTNNIGQKEGSSENRDHDAVND